MSLISEQFVLEIVENDALTKEDGMILWTKTNTQGKEVLVPLYTKEEVEYDDSIAYCMDFKNVSVRMNIHMALKLVEEMSALYTTAKPQASNVPTVLMLRNSTKLGMVVL